jgi:hypothetical protein
MSRQLDSYRVHKTKGWWYFEYTMGKEIMLRKCLGRGPVTQERIDELITGMRRLREMARKVEMEAMLAQELELYPETRKEEENA